MINKNSQLDSKWPRCHACLHHSGLFVSIPWKCPINQTSWKRGIILSLLWEAEKDARFIRNRFKRERESRQHMMLFSELLQWFVLKFVSKTQDSFFSHECLTHWVGESCLLISTGSHSQMKYWTLKDPRCELSCRCQADCHVSTSLWLYGITSHLARLMTALHDSSNGFTHPDLFKGGLEELIKDRWHQEVETADWKKEKVDTTLWNAVPL